MTTLNVDEKSLCYACNGHKRVIPVTDIQQIRWQYQPSIRHPIIAVILTLCMTSFVIYWFYHYGLNLGTLFFPRGGLVLMPMFFITYMIWQFMLYRKIPWLMITHINGQVSQLPLENFRAEYIELIIRRVESISTITPPCSKRPSC